MLEQGEVLTLDNKDYSVVYSTEINSINYAYLINQNDYSDVFFCEFDGDSQIRKTENPDIIEQILKNYKNITE